MFLIEWLVSQVLSLCFRFVFQIEIDFCFLAERFWDRQSVAPSTMAMDSSGHSLDFLSCKLLLYVARFLQNNYNTF